MGSSVLVAGLLSQEEKAEGNAGGEGFKKGHARETERHILARGVDAQPPAR